MNIRIPESATFFLGFAALIVAALLVLSQPATAQRTGPYILVAHSNQTASAGVFRINESTGQVSFCYVDGTATPSNAGVKCTAEVE